MKTLVFCTAYSSSTEWWQQRYRFWVDSLGNSRLGADQLLLVDDGSPVLPSWTDTVILSDGDDLRCADPKVLWHFRERLGRPSNLDYPGWHRSFTFAARYALANNFRKVIHIEADAFLVSDRIQDYINELDDGWTAFWCRRHQMPESAIQVVAGASIGRFLDFATRPYSEFIGKPIEHQLPFTRVEKRFTGDRYGEFQKHVPRDADWAGQCSGASGAMYFWWISSKEAQLDRLKLRSRLTKSSVLCHDGIPYVDMIAELSVRLSPGSYFEIGTETGASIRALSCDVLCVDPNFQLTGNIVGTRSRTLLYQMTSDEFFEKHGIRTVFPAGADLAFLDGLHLHEALLQDFINTERSCHQGTIVLIHDCLPRNRRMTERAFVDDPTEDPETKDWWTGDAWRLLPILKKYRPDLDILYLDCPPTGLVACIGLNPGSTVLGDNYDQLCQEAQALTLSEFGLERLWSLFPTIDSRRMCNEPENIPYIFQRTNDEDQINVSSGELVETRDR